MLSPAAIDGVTAAFMVGLASSPHCALMCGPLGCAVLTAGRPQAETIPALAIYHALRLFSYMLVGALAGGIGTAVSVAFDWPLARALPWVLVSLLIAFALRLDRFFPKPVWLGRWHRQLMAKARAGSTTLLGGLLGLATPFLPCGPLYLIFTVSFFTGSAARGAALALAFGAGTLPLLWLAQATLIRWQVKLSFASLGWAKCVMALVAAGIVAWRASAVGPGWLEAICH